MPRCIKCGEEKDGTFYSLGWKKEVYSESTVDIDLPSESCEDFRGPIPMICKACFKMHPFMIELDWTLACEIAPCGSVLGRFNEEDYLYSDWEVGNLGVIYSEYGGLDIK